MSNEPSLKWHRAIVVHRWSYPTAHLRLEAIGFFAGLFACAAVLFAWRRLSGVLTNPLSPALLVASGVLVGVAALGIRAVWRRSSGINASLRGNLVLDIVLGASLLLFAASLSLPNSNAWGLGFLWLFIAAEEIWSWQSRIRRLLGRMSNKITAIQPAQLDRVQAIAPHIESTKPAIASASDILALPVLPGKDVTQQLTRSTAADGSEVLSGWLRLNFTAGQRIGNLHVAFCPPFSVTPELKISQLDGPEARIKIAQLLPYGARLDIKLNAFPPESASVFVQFTAQSTSGDNHNS